MQLPLRTGMAALTLLLFGACATAPTKVSTPLPPQAALLPARQTTPPPVAIPNEIPPSTEPAVITTEELVITGAPRVPNPVATASQPAYYQSSASYYAKRFEGRRTASGERYDPAQLTAATRDFPLQSWLKVINPANGKEVIVRINDRTGKRKTPLIDLSRAAANKLGFLGKGKIRVHVIPILPPAL